ncbi:6-phosphogluconate dehydrogenase [Mycena latifolia]|nr:6-phosphogluconate dehydrogenase [Mycena latifolia]
MNIGRIETAPDFFFYRDGPQQPISRQLRSSRSRIRSTIRAPTDLKHRYFTEDIPHVLVPWCQLGEIVRIKTPNIWALIVLASTTTGIDFMEEGGTQEHLGWTGCRGREF